MKKKRCVILAVIAGAAAVICGGAGIRQYLAEKDAGGSYEELRMPLKQKLRKSRMYRTPR